MSNTNNTNDSDDYNGNIDKDDMANDDGKYEEKLEGNGNYNLVEGTWYQNKIKNDKIIIFMLICYK